MLPKKNNSFQYSLVTAVIKFIILTILFTISYFRRSMSHHKSTEFTLTQGCKGLRVLPYKTGNGKINAPRRHIRYHGLYDVACRHLMSQRIIYSSKGWIDLYADWGLKASATRIKAHPSPSVRLIRDASFWRRARSIMSPCDIL